MRYYVAAILCLFTLSAGLASSDAFACKNGKCPMSKSGKKCNHKDCEHCKEHAKGVHGDAKAKVEKPAGETEAAKH